MSWLVKVARSDRVRLESNIKRLEALKNKIHELGFYVVSSQSGGYEFLKTVLEENLVLGRPLVYEKLKQALIGENNQKLALDAPTRFQGIMKEAEELIYIEIMKEHRALRDLGDE